MHIFQLLYIYQKMSLNALGMCGTYAGFSVFASEFPEFDEQVYDKLFEKIILENKMLNDSGYLIYFFCDSPAPKPPWSYLLKEYYQLPQITRKQIQALYIVHPTRWTKTIFNLAGYILSPKFTRKLHWVESLCNTPNYPFYRDDILPEGVLR